MSPSELARLLEQPEPTAQQQAVISATLTEPHLVVAGAGSGKTATMANRVVWLVANGLVHPSEVLGLTFTRKAAGELNDRIVRQLDQYDRSVDGESRSAYTAERPTVSTYNAFAAAVYRDHALLIGYEPDATVISESVAWQLAYRVVAESSDPRLDALDVLPGTLVDAVLSLARELADHGASGHEVAQFAKSVHANVAPLVDSIRLKARRTAVEGYLANVALLPLLVDLAAEYQAAKRFRGFIEFSDQVALAHRIITEHPVVAEAYRSRYRVVLLDEYQDTSVAQTRFLAELFRGCGVMAVGDPDQSIYGFRGASAANLSRFSEDFGAGGAFPLSMSWRNSHRVLDVANLVTERIERTPGAPKEPLAPSPIAQPGEVFVQYADTILDEAAIVANWFDERRSRAGAPPKMALLLRAKKHFPVFVAALRERNIPVHVLGLSGLLSEPVIVDLTSALAVLADSTANAELLRLLSGARWAIGPADIRELHLLARTIAEHDEQGRRRSNAERDAARQSVEDIDTSSLIEALDAIATGQIPRPEWLAGFSEVGLERLRAAGSQLASLRRRSMLRIGDLVELVSAELLLDIEAQANPDAPLAANALEAFHDVVNDYLALAEDASLTSFLTWLETAEQREAFAPRQDPPEPGAVQIMTMHAAKGLEWDFVALPRLVVDEMPSKGQDVAGWLTRGRLPYRFRGDRAELPTLHWESVSSAEALEAELDTYLEAVKHGQSQEEWRLGYVAVTRPRAELLLTGSWWGGQQKPREPGALLRIIAEGVLGDAAESWRPASLIAQPPSLSVAATVWPLPPLGHREQKVRAAAAAVRTATGEPSSDLDELITLLLAERDGSGGRVATLPVRIPASRVKDYLEDAEEVARERFRPMPQRPYVATRLGTLFHSWVEHRSVRGLEIDAFDDEAESEDLVMQEQLAQFQRTFERSPWADLQPIDVEREIHLPLGGNVFICKIDAVYDVSAIDVGQPHGARVQIVDWKTGAAPQDEADLERKQSQLSLYRLAYARHLGIPAKEIDAVFYFVADDRIVRPTALLSESEFLDEWSRIEN
ncbi:MAG: UvrD-helicase domain-containing protein [Agromyces sp.]